MGTAASSTADAGTSVGRALATLQDGLRDERLEWEEELMGGLMLVRLADNGHYAGDPAPEEGGHGSTWSSTLAGQSLV